MMVRELMDMLRSQDIKVWTEGDKLRCSVPKGISATNLMDELKRRKEEVLSFLNAGKAVHSSLVPIQPKGSKPPFFGIPGHNGDVFCYVPLARLLGRDQPFYVLQPPGFNRERTPYDTIPELANYYRRELKAFLPNGPYFLGGYCAGGTVVFELAQQMVAAGDDVAFLALFHSPFPTSYLGRYAFTNAWHYLKMRIPYHMQMMSNRNWAERTQYILHRTRFYGTGAKQQPENLEPKNSGNPEYRTPIEEATMKGVRSYRPKSYPGPIHLFMAFDDSRRYDFDRVRTWMRYAAKESQLYTGPDGCEGSTMLLAPYVGTFKDYLEKSMNEESRRMQRK